MRRLGGGRMRGKAGGMLVCIWPDWVSWSIAFILFRVFMISKWVLFFVRAHFFGGVI